MKARRLPLNKVIELIDSGKIKKLKKPLLIEINTEAYREYLTRSKEERIEILNKLENNKDSFSSYPVNIYLEKITDYKLSQMDLGALNKYTTIYILIALPIEECNWMGIVSFQEIYEKILGIAEILKKQVEEMLSKLEKKSFFKGAKLSSDVIHASLVATHLIKRMDYYPVLKDISDFYSKIDKKQFSDILRKNMNSFLSLGFYNRGAGASKEFSIIFKHYMDILGVESQIVRVKLEEDKEHFYNKVNLDGNWYVIDLTRIEEEREGEFIRERLFTSEEFADSELKMKSKENILNKNLEEYIKRFHKLVSKRDEKYFAEEEYIKNIKDKYEAQIHAIAKKNHPQQEMIKEFMELLYPEIIADDKISNYDYIYKRIEQMDGMFQLKLDLIKSNDEYKNNNKENKAKTNNINNKK